MNWMQREEIITSTQDWTAPEARNQEFEVTIWGAGGSGSMDANYFTQVGGAGGAGCFIEAGPNNTVSKRIGSGGSGVCVIRYYSPIG